MQLNNGTASFKAPSEPQAKQLDKPIPREAVSERSDGRVTLSYLEGWYVINRLNQVLGQGNWSYQTINISKVFDGFITSARGTEQHYTSYTALVQLSARIDGNVVVFSDVGFGDGRDSSNPGKTHELAVKEAVTDGLKRCAKNLGMSMGLALYDKSQANVIEAEASEVPANVPTTNTPANSSAVTFSSKDSAIKELKKIITVAEETGMISRQEYKDHLLKTYQQTTMNALTLEQLQALYNHLKVTYTKLNLA